MLALYLLLASPVVLGQLQLPDPPYIPQDSTKGSEPSSDSSLPNPQWTALLGNGLYFYEAQRSGALPSNNRVSWRNSSSLDDGKDVGIDLTGGYYDAGDYIKATFPLSLTLMSICWGATDFGQGYDMANQTAYLDTMLRWGLDWLIKAHPDDNTLYVLVADPHDDGNYWGGDQNIPTPRSSYKIDDNNPGTDAAAAASAAFSACSNLYMSKNDSFGSPFKSPAALSDNTYGQTLLNHAKSLYNFAVHAKGGQKFYQESVPEVADAYSSSSYQDDLTLAALFLALASNSSDLYQEAQNLYTTNHLAAQDRVFNWDSKGPAIPVLFSQVAQKWKNDTSSWKKDAETYFDRILDSSGQGTLTSGGLLFYDGDSDDASLNPALNAAMLMARYAPIATTDDRKKSYQSFADSQLAYVLGNNPMSVPYIVGSNPNSPSNPHSAPASGKSGFSNLDDGDTAYVLYGGVVGGPDRNDRFWNIRSDWPETEVALDYTAPLLTLTAMHVMFDNSDPFYTRLQAGEYDERKPSGLPCDPVFPCSRTNHMPKGAKIAIAVVISVVGLVVFGLFAWYCLLITRSSRKL